MTEEQPKYIVDLTKTAKERIREAFTGLIPEELWDQMIKDEWDSFFKPQEVKDSYHNQTKTVPSKFSCLISQILNEELKVRLGKKLEEELNKIAWQKETNEVLQQLVSQSADVLIKTFIQKIIESAVQNMQKSVGDAFL